MKTRAKVTGIQVGALSSWLAALFCAGAACSTSTPVVAEGCTLNSDCQATLVCALGKCSPQCRTAVDCPVTDSTCIDDGRSAFCETPADQNTPCTREADCPTPLACASDYRCRNLCMTAADCNVLGITGRVCAEDQNGVDYCADPDEVSDAGVIDRPPPAGAPLGTPVVEPEGGTSAPLVTMPDGGISAAIGQGGGTLGLPGVRITVPPNALNSTVTITVEPSTQLGPPGMIGQVFEIGPTGTIFNQNVTIAFDYTETSLGGLPPSDFAVETSTDGGANWTPLSQIVVDITAQTIAGQTTHLSPYVLVQQGVQGDASSPSAYADAASGVDSGAGGGGGYVLSDGAVPAFDAASSAGDAAADATLSYISPDAAP